MARIWEVYTNDIHQNFKSYYANWPPNVPIRLGDFGILDHNLFKRKGNVKEIFNVNFDVRSGEEEKSNYEYKSSDSTEITFSAKGQGGNGPVSLKASVTLDFSRSDSVFFFAAGCDHRSIENEIGLGSNILKIFDEEKWDDEWVIVTRVVVAAATTVIISSGDNASITLETDARPSGIDLADASMRLGLRHEKNIGFKVITQQGLIPLLAFSKVNVHWWSRDASLESYGLFSTAAALPPALTEYDSIALRKFLKDTKRPLSDAFHFGRVT